MEIMTFEQLAKITLLVNVIQIKFSPIIINHLSTPIFLSVAPITDENQSNGILSMGTIEWKNQNVYLVYNQYVFFKKYNKIIF